MERGPPASPDQTTASISAVCCRLLFSLSSCYFVQKQGYRCGYEHHRSQLSLADRRSIPKTGLTLSIRAWGFSKSSSIRSTFGR